MLSLKSFLGVRGVPTGWKPVLPGSQDPCPLPQTLNALSRAGKSGRKPRLASPHKGGWEGGLGGGWGSRCSPSPPPRGTFRLPPGLFKSGSPRRRRRPRFSPSGEASTALPGFPNPSPRSPSPSSLPAGPETHR
jgi:hypothetical protein